MKISYHSPTPGEIPIFAHGPVPAAIIDNQKDVDETTSTRYVKDICKTLEDCGFNCLLGESSKISESLLKAITTNKCKLGVLLRLQTMTKTPSGAFQRINHFLNENKGSWDTSLIKGWSLIDEPLYYMWGDATYNNGNTSISMIEWNRLSVGYEISTQLTPHLLTYWNLAVPQKNSSNLRDTIGDYENYEQYLGVLNTLFKPSMWSYDIYPILHIIKDNEIKILHGHFYNGLRMFAKMYEDGGPVFWTTCVAYKHLGLGQTYLRPLPTLGTLRFENFSALACGAQGIIYYQLAISNPPSTTQAAISYKDNELVFDAYLLNLFKTVNAEIQQFKEIFLGAKPVEILHAGRGYDDGLNVANGLFPFFAITVFDSNGNIVSQKNAGDWDGVLMTSFITKNRSYAMIVSHNPYAIQQVKLTFAELSFVIKSPSLYSENMFSIPVPMPDIDIENSPYYLPPDTLAKSGYFLLPIGGYIIIDITGR